MTSNDLFLFFEINRKLINLSTGFCVLSNYINIWGFLLFFLENYEQEDLEK